MSNEKTVRNLMLAAMFVAVGFVLPMITGQVPQVGQMLLPMHIPVLLCGLICGWRYGGVVGFVLPLARSMLLGMPPLFPIAIAMSFELATYGIIAGLVYGLSRWQCTVAIYRALVVAMFAGRAVWGIVMAVLLGVGEGGFGMQLFVAGAFVNAVPGIILQLVLIPAIIVALSRTGVLQFQKARES